MRVPSASPAWAWGNWYQSGSYHISDHDLADLDFATGLLQTQPRLPVMQSEFQAGWLQGADEAMPRPSDPSNTAIALAELLRDGAHGIVNFPVQDTIDPHGWEAPWANWSYAWNAALTVDLRAAPRFVPTREFGDVVRRYGDLLAATHVAADASIIWPPTLFSPGSLSVEDFAVLASATSTSQRACGSRGLTCTLVDLRDPRAELQRLRTVLFPSLPSSFVARMSARGASQLRALRNSGRLVASAASVHPVTGLPHVPHATLLLADDGSYGFLVAVNPGDAPRRVAAGSVRLGHRMVGIAPFVMPPHGSRIVAIGVRRANPPALPEPPAGTPPPFADPGGTTIANAHLRIVFAPFAGARIAELGDAQWNAATSIGLLRDAVDPPPPVSPRDYIAAYTHPMPAGTFNRAYVCTRDDALTTQRETCGYDAPDLHSGGGTFSRTLTLTNGGSELLVGEQFQPHDRRSKAHLESISGFAFAAGDRLVISSSFEAIGILHGDRLALLRWHRTDVAHAYWRSTRGAELVTLVFARPSIELHLGVHTVSGVAEAQRLVDAKEP
jgi:hypothetical protein